MPVGSRTLTRTSTGALFEVSEEGLLDRCPTGAADVPPVGRCARIGSARKSQAQEAKTPTKRRAIGMGRGTIEPVLEQPKSAGTVTKTLAGGQANRRAVSWRRGLAAEARDAGVAKVSETIVTFGRISV
jgi:hypothetical protein